MVNVHQGDIRGDQSWMSTRQQIRCDECQAEFATDGGAWAHAVGTAHERFLYRQPDGSWVVG